MRSSTFLALPFLATSCHSAFSQTTQCPSNPQITYIEKGVNDNPAFLIAAVSKSNVMVLLAPDVDIDFSQVISPIGAEEPLIELGRCVTLASYQPTIIPPLAAPIPPVGGEGQQPVPGSGRTPHSLGPVLRYGTNPKRSTAAAFIEANCSGDPSASNSADGTRILGFRVFGPTFADQHTSEKGINIRGCPNAEIANMEIAGWGEAAVRIDNSDHEKGIPTAAPNPISVLIHDNYIHHNQNSEHNGSSLGYGVEISTGAFASIYQNVFDYNKHSITASGFAGGYNAGLNLILKGGGLQNSRFERNIHVVDVHGTANCPDISGQEGFISGAAAGAVAGGLIGSLFGPIGAAIGGLIGGILGGLGGEAGAELTQHLFNCGDAGFAFLIDQNAIQYTKTTDLKIRGKPKQQAVISNNIFARKSRGDAIQLQTSQNVQVDASNKYDDDTFGHYGVCDIDGDGVDDLILMTGVSWWFSSGGQYPWSFLRADNTVLKDVALGELEGDTHCDVVKDGGNGMWMVSRGAVGDWQPLGNFGAPLSEARLGRFDPNQTDYNRGIKPLTHAFWRRSDGTWLVDPLSQPNAWKVVASSSAPLTSLRFGDVIGDGVTDVLANIGGHWAFSYAASSPWETLNTTLDDPLAASNIFIANLDADDNLDDALRLSTGISGNTTAWEGTSLRTATWQRSLHGRTSWSEWKAYAFTVGNAHPEDYVGLGPVFTGQFGSLPGDATLTIDPDRIGHFFSPAQGQMGEGWLSLFAY